MVAWLSSKTRTTSGDNSLMGFVSSLTVVTGIRLPGSRQMIPRWRLMLARMLVDQGTYNAKEALKAYIYWLESNPFDCGSTVASGLRGRPNPESQANGAMMRISPLGIFGANHDLSKVAEWARQDAASDPSPSNLPTGQRSFHYGHCPGHSHRNRARGPLSTNFDLGKRDEGGGVFVGGYHWCGHGASG